MHSLSEFGANVPAFLAKLWKLVDDPETNELISWSEEGTSFYIRDQAQFSRKLLPMYYKHNNMASFIRQLNMYGFHKIVSADAGSLRLDKDEMEFAHQCFLRGHPYLLEHIKRKVGKSQMLSSKQIEEAKDGSNGGVVVKAEFMNKMLSEVKNMRGRQETVESRLTAMKQENEALWRELSLLRQKHIKQQTIVNKLIQFLVTLVQPSQRLSKRRYPLMINSVAHPNGKTNGKVINTNDSMPRSPSGPTIHELDGDSLLPDGELGFSDTDPSPNTITLHVPGTELAEVIENSLEPGVMSPDAEILDSLDPSIISAPLTNSLSSVPSIEVNSEEDVLAEEGLKTSSPSPELLLAVPPSELNPAVVVPRLQNKNSSNLSRQQITAQKILTRSAAAAAAGPSRSIVTRKSAAGTGKAVPSSGKTTSLQYQGALDQEVKRGAVEPQPVVKKELRVLPQRNRKKKRSNSKDSSFAQDADSLDETMKPVDLLAEVGLVDPASPNTTASASVNHATSNGCIGGSVTSQAPSQFVAYPESPVPIIHSPVSSPSPHCSVVHPVAVPSLAGPTITDVTSPLVVQPPTSLPSEQLSPQSSPVGSLNSPYDMTLACTSQAGSSPASNTTPYKSTAFNREDLDLHVGTMDNELGQLKEFLNNSGIQLDANTLLGLFAGDESLLPEGDVSNFSTKMDPSGNELMYYQPDFMDMEEMWNNDDGRSASPLSPLDVMESTLNTPVMMPSSPGFSGPPFKRRRN